jgi:hypothetical protein
VAVVLSALLMFVLLCFKAASLRPCGERSEAAKAVSESGPVNRRAEGFLQESGPGRFTGMAAASASTDEDATRPLGNGDFHGRDADHARLTPFPASPVGDSFSAPSRALWRG